MEHAIARRLDLTEDSDAIVILVSEEAGEAHLVKNGKITTNLSEQEIRQSLSALLDISRSRRQYSAADAWLDSSRAKPDEARGLDESRNAAREPVGSC